MKIDDYRDGLPVLAKGQHGIAVELEKCGEDRWIIHVAFPGKEVQWRMPIEQVEVDPR